MMTMTLRAKRRRKLHRVHRKAQATPALSEEHLHYFCRSSGFHLLPPLYPRRFQPHPHRLTTTERKHRARWKKRSEKEAAQEDSHHLHSREKVGLQGLV